MALRSHERYRVAVLRLGRVRVEQLRRRPPPRRLAPRRPLAPERAEADRDEAVYRA